MKIVNKKITDINPAPYNPRKISDQAFEGLKESIKKFGMVDPLIVNKRSGVLVGGHQRLKACEALGMDSVPVVEVDLSVAEEKALNVTLNNQKISGEFDIDILSGIIDELKLEDFDLESLNLSGLDSVGELDDDFQFNPPSEPSDNPKKIVLRVEFFTEDERQELFDELKDRGLKVFI